MSQLPSAAQPAANLSLIADYNGSDDFSGMRARDIILPRAVVAQPTSPKVIEAAWNGGDVRDSATGSLIVPTKTEKHFIVPLMFWLEWIEWNKDRDCAKEARVVERSVDPTSKLAKRAEAWETWIDSQGKERATVTECYNFICAFCTDEHSDYDNMYMTVFSRSAHRIGKMWLNRMYKTKIQMADGQYVRAPMWSMRWAYKTMLEVKDNNRFFVPVIGDGKVNPDADLPQLKQIAEELKLRRSEIMERNSNKEAEAEVHTAAPNAEM